MASFDAPNDFRIGGADLRAIVNERITPFAVPFQAAFGAQVASEDVGQGFQIARVVARVVDHPGGERSLGPIGLLRPLLQSDAEIFGNEISEAKFPATEQPAGEHGVEDGCRHKAARFPQEPQVVIGAVQNQLVIMKDIESWLQLDWRERIEEFVLAFDADLNQAKFLWIGMEAVRLRIERNPFCGSHPRQKSFQLLVRVDHRRNIKHGSTVQKKEIARTIAGFHPMLPPILLLNLDPDLALDLDPYPNLLHERNDSDQEQEQEQEN
jgi:hypothetical protein